MAEKPPARHIGTHLPVPHDLLVDSGWHTCDESCPPVPPMPTFAWHQRARVKARRLGRTARRLSGYRLVHRDRIDRNG